MSNDKIEISNDKIEMKKCGECEQTKPITDFYQKNHRKCRECTKAAQRERNKQLKEQQSKIKSDPELKKQPKTCNKCNQTKTIGDFRPNRGECLDCERAYGREYNTEHHDVRQNWQDNNSERFAELKANLYQKNKPIIREKYNKRYAEDNCFRLHQNSKKQLQKNISKIHTIEDCAGKKFEKVAKWLEYNFTDEMTWDNHGTVWDVDHVIPVSKWDLNIPEQVEICFDWKNLSPLECDINRHKKSDKIDKELITRHIQRLKEYYQENELDENELKEYLISYKQQLTLLGETP